jgi:type VI secretion system protein VasD
MVRVLLIATLAALASCGTPPKPPADTLLNIRVTAEHGASKGPSGQALRISVLLYELSSNGKFLRADFFGLYDDAAKLLGADLIATERVNLLPGGTERLTRKVAPNVRYLGVLAAYRNIDAVSWRDAIAVQPNQINGIAVEVRAEGVSVYAEAGKTP